MPENRLIYSSVHYWRSPLNSADALRAVGAKPVPHIKRWFPLPTSVTCSVHEVTIPDDAALFAVAVKIRVDAGTARVLLLTADDLVQDRVECRARSEVYDCVLYTSCIRTAVRVHIELSTPTASAILRAEVFSLSSSCIAANKLMNHRRLMADPNWGYARPDVEDTIDRLRDRVFAMITTPTPVRWLNNLTIFLEPRDELSRVLMITGLYEPETMIALQERLPKGGTFVDVGAHCGCYTLFAASCVGPAGTIVSFEPSSREFSRLVANVALNGLTQIDAREIAITDTPGPIELRIADELYSGHNTTGARFAYDGVRTDHIAQVAGTTLDLELADLARCDVIKLDIEGGELRALRGASNIVERFRPVLIMEIFAAALAGFGQSGADVVAWLHAHDYVCYGIETSTGALVPVVEPLAADVSKNFIALPREKASLQTS